MRVSRRWLDENGVGFGSEFPQFGCALLTHYTAEYLEWGEGPPLVLIPGLAGGVGLVSPLAGFLARHFRVISYQLRGEDDCFVLRRRFGLPELVNDLAEFLDRLCLENPLVLGVSFGGVLALEFAARYPHRVSGLVAQGADVRFARTLLRQVAGQVLSGYPLPTDSPFVNQFFNLLFGGRQEDRQLFDFVTSQCWQTDQSVMAHRFRLAERMDLSGRLRRIKAPTLVISGERDVLVSANGVNELAQEIPQAELVKLPKAGHLAFVTHPREIAEQVCRFAEEYLPCPVEIS